METKLRKSIDINKLTMLSESIHPLKIVFDQMKDHVVITDENAVIIYANQAMERHTGFQIHEVIGKNPADVWGGIMPKEFYEHMWYQIKIKKQPFIADVQNRHKDGSLYWQELRISPILDATNNIKFFIALEPDIASKIDSHKTRQEFIAAFDQQTKHSFTHMRNILDWLTTHGRLNHKQKECLETLYKQRQNLSVLVGDFLDFLKTKRD